MTMRRIAIVLTVLLAVSAIGAGVAAQEGLSIRSADLAIDQPSHIDADVQEQQADGTTKYVATGAPLEIKPQNFDSDNVVNYGVDTAGADLSYDEAFGTYNLAAETNGTYELFWVIEQEVTVEEPVETNATNATGNTTTETTTRTEIRQYRYEALIQVDSHADVAVIESARLSTIQQDAREWRDFNSSVVQPLRERDFMLRPDDRSTEETIQGMVGSYITTSDPLSALSGNFTAVLVIMGTTIGGALVLILGFAYNVFSISALRSKLNRFELNEAEEGELAERKAAMTVMERLQTAANTDLQDIEQFDDYWAHQFRDAHGVNLRDSWESIVQQMLFQLPQDYLDVMTQNGYAIADAGDGVEIVPDDEVGDRDVLDVDDLSKTQLRSIDYDEPPVSTFDVSAADIDWTQLSESTPTLDLEDWRDEWGLDIDHDADLQHYAEMLVELARAVDEHEFTDSEGRIDPERGYLNSYLEAANTADQYDLPAAPQLRDLFEAALDKHSPQERTEQTVQDITDGRFSPGDD